MGLFSKNKKKKTANTCSVVLAAAGSSSRMNGADKLFCELGGVPVIERTLSALNSCEQVSEIVVVTREESLQKVAQLCDSCGFEKVSRVLVGGASRQESSYIGVMNCSSSSRLIAVHDAARPLVEHELISRVVSCAAKYGAAAPAIPVKDTIKTREGELVTSTPRREALAAVQTPQVFDADIIKAALTRAVTGEMSFTDDCAAVEDMGMPVHLVEGSEKNIKLTTPWDIPIAELYLGRND